MSRKWLVLDCGDWIEAVEIGCGGGETRRRVKRQALLDARWNPTNESYALGGGEAFSVRGMPTHVKDEIERVRISGTIDKKAAELEEALKKQRSSERIILGYLFVWVAVLFATLFWALSSQQFWSILLCLVLFFLFLALGQPFARRFAPWSGFLTFEDLLFIRVKHAIDQLDRFLADGRGEFLDEAVKMLSVSSLFGEITSRGPIPRVVQQVENEVQDLTQNIACRIAPHVRGSRDPKTFSQLVLGRLRNLLPILAKPDITAIASWNEAVRNEFPTLESRAQLTIIKRAFVSRPRILKALTLAGLLLAGYIMSALILFASQSILRGYVLQAGEFATVVKELLSTYLLLSTAMAALLAAVWLRK